MVQWEHLTPTKATWEDLLAVARHYLAFNLEDEVLFDEEGNVAPKGLDLITRNYEDYEEKNGPTLNANLENGAFMGHGLRAKAGPSIWTIMWRNKRRAIEVGVV